MSDTHPGSPSPGAWPSPDGAPDPWRAPPPAGIQDAPLPGYPPLPPAAPAPAAGSGPGPAPGWYHDDNGVVRWWNGFVWDVGAPPPAGPAPYGYPAPVAMTENRSMAMLAHLGAFVGGFILPLVLMLTTGKTDPFVRHHSIESLDFQLTYLTFFLGGFVLSIATLGFGFLVFIPLLIAVAIGHIVFAIMACMAANRGEWYRYPICIRYVKHT